MEKIKENIEGIPAIIWGRPSDKVYIHVHGKMSRKEHAEGFAQIAENKGYQTVSFDLPEHGERQETDYPCDIWNGIKDLNIVADYVFPKWKEVSLFGCSLGVYFSLNAYKDRKLQKCLFQSPLLDMEYLIKQMFIWFDVTEERLQEEKEIPTAVDTLSWDYYQYVKGHPIEIWNTETVILYGGKDNMQPIEVIKEFSDKFNCSLTVSEKSEHPFMAEEDKGIVDKWLKENI